jgi:hypothetical protein
MPDRLLQLLGVAVCNGSRLAVYFKQITQGGRQGWSHARHCLRIDDVYLIELNLLIQKKS